MEPRDRPRQEPASVSRSGDRRRKTGERGRQGWRRSKPATAGRALVAPSVIILFIWMIVPLVMTLYFSLLHYSLLDPDNVSFVGLANYASFLSDPDFIAALINTLVLVISVLIISVCGGLLVGASDGSAGVRAERTASHGDRAVFRHADGERAGVEKPVDEPRLRASSPGSQSRLALSRSSGSPTGRCFR